MLKTVKKNYLTNILRSYVLFLRPTYLLERSQIKNNKMLQTAKQILLKYILIDVLPTAKFGIEWEM